MRGALLNFNIADNVLTGITGIPGLTNAINPSLKAKYPETFTAKDTEFKELKANFDLADGRMNVKNMRMAAAEFVVQGTGWADFERKVDFRATLTFSQRLSADLSQSAREMKYLLNNQGQLEVPFVLTGKMPNVKPRPDTRYLGQMVQRGFLRKGTEELQNRFLGGSKDSAPQNDQTQSDPSKKKKTSTEDMIQPTLELIRKYLPRGARIKKTAGSHWSCVDSAKARRVLGFKPAHVWQKYYKGDPGAVAAGALALRSVR